MAEKVDARALAEAISAEILSRKKNLKYRPVITGSEYQSSEVQFYLSTGASVIDAALAGGIPVGRITEVAGKESVGKSLLLEEAILSAQKRGGVGAVIDAETTFNKPRFASMGGDPTQVLFIEAPTLEDGFYNIKHTAAKIREKLPGVPVVIGWDTICTNKTYNQVKGGQFSGGMMEAPRVIWDSLRELSMDVIAETNISLIIVNQVYGDNVHWGGGGIRFYSSIRLRLEKQGTFYSKRTGRHGEVMRIHVVKSKVSPPLLQVSFCCDGHGMNDPLTLYYNLMERNLITASGSWKSVTGPDGTKWAWQNEEGLYEKLQDPRLADAMAQLVWKTFPPPNAPVERRSAEFVAKHKAANPWLEADKYYARCAISGHYCPGGDWSSCQGSYWTKCNLKLPDVVPLKRVYYEPPIASIDSAAQLRASSPGPADALDDLDKLIAQASANPNPTTESPLSADDLPPE